MIKDFDLKHSKRFYFKYFKTLAHLMRYFNSNTNLTLFYTFYGSFGTNLQSDL